MTFQITRAFKGLEDELQRAQKRCCLAGEAQARMWGRFESRIAIENARQI